MDKSTALWKGIADAVRQATPFRGVDPKAVRPGWRQEGWAPVPRRWSR